MVRRIRDYNTQVKEIWMSQSLEYIRKLALPIRSSLLGAQISNHVNIDFAVIGFPKCATTSIHKTLRCMPQIFMPDFEVQVPSLAKSWLSLPATKCILGIKNPNIIYEPHNLEALRKSNRDMRLVISMRKPSEWLYSFYQYRMLEMKNERRWLQPYLRKHPEYRRITFDDIVYKNASFLGVTVSAGFYVDYLVNIYKLWPAENILVLMTEEIAEYPEQTYLRIAKFLKISKPAEIASGIKANVNKKRYGRRQKYAKHLSYLDEVYADKNRELNLFLRQVANYDNVHW